MPIEVTGKLGGTFYDGVNVDVKTLIDKLDLKDVLYTGERLNENVTLQFAERLTKIVNGQKRTPKGFILPNHFYGVFNGNNIQFRYYQQRFENQNKEGPKYNYLPRKTKLDKKFTMLRTNDDLEHVVFMIINTRCGTSPLHRKTDQLVYSVRNTEKESQDKLINVKIEMEVYKTITAGDIKTLRTRAKGMGVAGVDRMNDDELRASLLTTFRNAQAKDRGDARMINVNKFIEKLNSPLSHLKGMVREAMDKGIILYKPVAGTLVFEWGKGQDNKGRICKGQKGEKPFDSLYLHISSNLDFYFNALKNAINKSETGKGLKDKVSDLIEYQKTEDKAKDVKDMSSKEILSFCIMKGLIYYDPTKKAVLNIKKGKSDGDPLFEPQTPGRWMEEFSIFINSDTKTLTKLKQKIIGFNIKNK